MSLKKFTKVEAILKDIEQSGFPIEIKSANILKSDGWTVSNQSGYLDPDENKLRAIDIIANKAVNLSDSKIYKRFIVSLIIECKKSVKPWVFFIENKDRENTFNTFMALALLKYYTQPSLHPAYIEKMTKCLHYFSISYNDVAVIYYEPFTKGQGRNIFEATNQVIKCQNHQVESVSKLVAKYQDLTIANFYYALIIFDGNIYVISHHEDKPILTPSKYVQYLDRYRPTTVGDMSIVDIVQIDYLQDYLKMLDNEIECLKSELTSLNSPSIPPF